MELVGAPEKKGERMIQNDLKFFTNEPERDLYSRFATILKSNTQFFDGRFHEGHPCKAS